MKESFETMHRKAWEPGAARDRNRLQHLWMLILMLFSAPLAEAKVPVKFTEIYAANSPLITFRIILRSGSINDPKGKEGLNLLTASMLAQGGTKILKYEEVVAKLYPWAADISVSPEKEITTFVGKVHRDHLDSFYALLSGLLLSPRFDPEDFSRNRDLAINSLEKNLRGTDDENLGKEALGISLFAHHPYGTADATVQGLKSITLDDIKEFYRKTFTCGNLWIGIAGGYPKSLIATMKKDFDSLPDGGFVPLPLPQPEKIEGLELLLVEKPARATALSMGHTLEVTRKDKDYYPLLLANSYLGEHRTFNGVLMRSLREDRGLNYGDYSYIERFIGGVDSNSRFPNVNTPLRQQVFSIWLRPIPPEKACFAIRAALYELDRFVKNGLTKEQFEQARKFLNNYSKLWAQTLDRRLGYKMDSEFYGSEYYIDRIEKELKTLTVAEVNRVIQKYISSKNLKIAVVTDKGQQFLDALDSNAPCSIEYSSPVSNRILEEDKMISHFSLEINKAKSKIVPVKELFENESPK
jgi:zinc protease